MEYLFFFFKMILEIMVLDEEFLIVNKLFIIAKDFFVKIELEDLVLY